MSNLQALNDRLNFMNFGPHAQSRLRGMKSVIMSALPRALEAFYEKMRAVPETAKFFPNEELVRLANGKQHGHWDRITDGRLDESYAKAAMHVGEVHARIGLEPRWYIGGYTIVLEHLINAIITARWPASRWGRKLHGQTELKEEIAALVKATFLDMDMALTVYAGTFDTKRAAAEAKLQSAADTVVAAMGAAMRALAAGDLTHRLGDNIPAEYSQLRLDFNTALERLSGTLASMQSSSRAISGSVEEIAAAADDMSRRTEAQAANLEQTTAALGELTEAVKRTADGAAQVNVAVGAANTEAESSRSVVGEAGAAMGKIEILLPRDRQYHRADRRNCLPDQSAGAECRGGGRPRRGCRAGLRRRRLRGTGAGATLRRGGEGDQVADLRLLRPGGAGCRAGAPHRAVAGRHRHQCGAD